MNTPGAKRLAVLTAALLSLPLIVACGDDGEPIDGVVNPFVGTWTATSFEIEGFDIVEDGVSLDFTFDDNGQYAIAITGDEDNIFCDPGSTSCTTDGSYIYTGNTITFDPGTSDEVAFAYDVSGSLLTLSGDIDGNAVTATLQKT